jgi:hypothetical protein
MFQICVFDQKVQWKKIGVMFLELILNAMIKNIKICNMFDIIEIPKSTVLNKHIH